MLADVADNVGPHGFGPGQELEESEDDVARGTRITLTVFAKYGERSR